MIKKPKFTVFDIVTVIIVLGIIFFSKFLFQFAISEGESMYPTINDKDYLLMLKTDNYSKNDIIIFKYGEDYLVKRVIATEGDTVELKDSFVYVNNTLLKEDYLDLSGNITYNYRKFKVPENSCYVLGDNRNHSLDSRFFNEVKDNQVLGVVKLNFTKLGLPKYLFNLIEGILTVLIILVQLLRFRNT